jgi:hypothetical protein
MTGKNAKITIRNTLKSGDIGELESAAHLYAKNGFVKTEEIRHKIWGAYRIEEKYEKDLAH